MGLEDFTMMGITHYGSEIKGSAAYKKKRRAEILKPLARGTVMEGSAVMRLFRLLMKNKISLTSGITTRSTSTSV